MPKLFNDFDLARARVHLQEDLLEPKEVEALAWKVFHESRILAYEEYSREDVGVHVRFRQGSLDGLIEVIASASAVYYFIANYPSFKVGIREMAGDSKKLASRLATIAPLRDLTNKARGDTIKADAGSIDRIHRIFERVKNGNLDRSSGLAKVTEILEEFGEIPDQVKAQLSHAFETMPTAGKQTSIEIEPVEEETTTSTKSRKRSSSSIGQREEWEIDIISRHRNDDPEIHKRNL